MTVFGTDTMLASTMSGIPNTPRHVRSRTQSISSDRPSTIGYNLLSPPPSISPEAAFIAASAASQIVTNDHDSHAGLWYDDVGLEPSGETALVSPGALQLANNFVDQLLFDILGHAKSTRLSALRPAVSDVLKPKLARDAINQADEELREYLGGGEIDDLVQSPGGDSVQNWDLELVWKRTRLRCMVYSSLGDMEDEDEDYYMEQEHLTGEAGDFMSEVVSPAVAIFLTSILEFLGEQVLVIAGQQAFNRLRVQYAKDLKEGVMFPGDIAERVLIEELDMERVGLDRSLGRLWRAWKKRVRDPQPRPFSRARSRRGSFATDVPAAISPRDAMDVEPVAVGTEEEHTVKEPEPEAAPVQVLEPADVPLPISHNDVNEIEVPGLVSYSDDEDEDDIEDEDEIVPTPRPKSMVFFPEPAQPEIATEDESEASARPHFARQRSNSVPTPAMTRFKSMISALVGEEVPTADGADSKEVVESLEPAAEAVDVAEGAEVTKVTQNAEASPDEIQHTSSSTDEEKRVEQEEPEVETGVEHEKNRSMISEIAAGVSVLGAVAAAGVVAGVAAIAQGSAPKTDVTPMEDIESDEEPEILTSSRVSLGGRSSPATSETGRPASIVPVRSNSVRSVRVIAVQGPKSPVLRPPSGSGDRILSREAGRDTPPIVEEHDVESKAMKTLRQASRSVSPGNLNDIAPSASPFSSQPKAQSPPTAQQAPTSAPVSAPTKVTMLPPSASNGTFLDLDNTPEVPYKAPTLRQPPLPTLSERSALPERSPARQLYNAPAPINPPPVDRAHALARTSPESPKLTRPVQTEAPSPASTKFKAVRSSEDSGLPQRAEDVARNFEELLQNDQTLQYTLTPENMRDIDASTSQDTTNPLMNARSRKSEDARQNERSRSSSLQRSMSVNKPAAMSSHPSDLPTNGKLSGPVPRAPPVSMSTNPRANAASKQARDARVARESIQDIAEFIRSTGPAGERGPGPQGRAPYGGVSHVRNFSGPTAPAKTSTDSRTSSNNRARLQARDPTVSSAGESSELADFIRRGPPSTANNPRIPRHVAPFRSTMDSDQLRMSGAGGGKAVDANIPDMRSSQGSTNRTEPSIEISVRSDIQSPSINSQSALLKQANRPKQYSNGFDGDDMVPKRKQRRVRDPYAIDISDDEDEGIDMAPKPQGRPRQEESLIDFLKNYDPPEAPPPQPFIASRALPKKKASAPNLIARLRSAGAASQNAVSSFSRNGSNVPDSRSLHSRASNAKSYNPIIASSPQAAPRVPMKKYEPRDPVSSNTKTSDLASFFRDSEPPASAMASMPSPTEERQGGFSRMFDRRKKSVAF